MSTETRVLVTSQSLLTEIGRCCKQFPSLHIAVAWCGHPKQTPVCRLLKGFGNNLTATVGVAFCHTHPDAIPWLRDKSANVRVFRGDEILFHPKVYFFTDRERYAVFVGSSNLTHGGFHGNAEVNTLIEGELKGGIGDDIRELQSTLEQWHSSEHSFEPTDEWLEDYRDQYRNAVAKAKRAEVRTPPVREEAEAAAGWLGTADWPTYYRRILEGLRQSGRTAREYHSVLDAAAEELPVPWRIAYFDDAEKRRIMGGISQYGWLGHVAAAGMLRRLLANITPAGYIQLLKLVHSSPWFLSPKPTNHAEGAVWDRRVAFMDPIFY